MPVENKNKVNIALIGDCNTGGLSERPLDNLAKALKSTFKDNNIDACIENYGQAMFTSREGVSISKDINLKFDFLILNFGLVDSWITTLPKIYVPYYPDGSWRKYRRKLLKSIKKRLRYPFFYNFLERGRVVPIEEFQNNIESVMQNLSDHSPGIQILLWGSAPVLNSEIKDKLIRSYDVSLERVAKDKKVLFLDTRALFERHEAESLYSDGLHINKKGYNILSREMCNVLKNEKY